MLTLLAETGTAWTMLLTLVAVKTRIQPNYSPSLTIVCAAGHKYWYASNMRTDEALVFVCYDSRNDGRARFTPHTGFKGRAVHDGHKRVHEMHGFGSSLPA